MTTARRELLDASRIEAGRIELTLRPIDLQHLVLAVTEEFQPQLDTKSQQFSTEFADHLPMSLCDESRVTQIIGNLLSNASKYTPAGGQIAIKAVPATEEGFIRVSVIDNGLGMSREDQAH